MQQQLSAPRHQPYLAWLALAQQALSLGQQRFNQTFTIEARLWPLLRTLKREALLRLFYGLDKEACKRSLTTLSKEQLMSSLQGLPASVLLQLVRLLPQNALKLGVLTKEQQLSLLQTGVWSQQGLLLSLSRLNPATLAQLAEKLGGGEAVQQGSFKEVWAVLFHAPQKQLLMALGLLNQQELSLLLLGLKAERGRLGEGLNDSLSTSVLLSLLQGVSKEALLHGLYQLPATDRQVMVENMPSDVLLQLFDSLPPETVLALLISQQNELL